MAQFYDRDGRPHGKQSRVRPWQWRVWRYLLALLTGGLLGAKGDALAHDAYLFFMEPCAWHAATVTGRDSYGSASALDVRYQRNGVADTATVSNAVLLSVRDGARVWVYQCERGGGFIRDEGVSLAPRRESGDAPQTSND